MLTALNTSCYSSYHVEKIPSLLHRSWASIMPCRNDTVTPWPIMNIHHTCRNDTVTPWPTTNTIRASRNPLPGIHTNTQHSFLDRPRLHQHRQRHCQASNRNHSEWNRRFNMNQSLKPKQTYKTEKVVLVNLKKHLYGD